MNEIAKLFDYFKRAFQVNKNNRGLYLPQITLILVKACYYLAFGIFLYQLTIGIGDMGFEATTFKEVFFSMAWWIGGMIVVGGLGSMVVEAGLFNMYKVSINDELIDSNIFFEGVRKYFIRILLANILMMIFWVAFAIPYFIISVFTLLAGFILIPLLITVFTTMWKVSMVIEDLTVIEGLKRGIRFSTKHFVPLSALVIIKQAFLSSQAGSSGNANAGNWDSSNNISKVTDNSPVDLDTVHFSFNDVYAQALPYIKTGFYILIPVVSIAIIIASMVRMVFEIFFELSIFVMYIEKSKEAELEPIAEPNAEAIMEVK